MSQMEKYRVRTGEGTGWQGGRPYGGNLVAVTGTIPPDDWTSGAGRFCRVESLFLPRRRSAPTTRSPYSSHMIWKNPLPSSPSSAEAGSRSTSLDKFFISSWLM